MAYLQFEKLICHRRGGDTFYRDPTFVDMNQQEVFTLVIGLSLTEKLGVIEGNKVYQKISIKMVS
jgi:hypothetical protein